MLHYVKDLARIDRNDILAPIFGVKPTVRILFYTDDFSVVLNNTSDFGVGILRDLILNNNPFYVNFEISLLNRHEGGHANHKLTPALLSTYDQVWFFGVRQTNRTPSELENELTTAEVAALKTWMQTGGVLMTGDHANPDPRTGNPDHTTYLNLGRAIGQKVPRAGQLRKWEGAPTAEVSDNHNTQVFTSGSPISPDNLSWQQDATPQQLQLKTYTVGTSSSYFVRRTRPHPLFCGRTGRITVFPDHMHEGALVIPATFNTDWAAPDSVRPEVVAWGTDKRNGNRYPIASVYDGDLAGEGRIVADSTWHHYFNVNLKGFPGTPTAPGEDLAKIANFYVNLAVWLSPKAKRQAMSHSIFWWLAIQPEVLEVARGSVVTLGQTAFDVLGRRASQCEALEFIKIYLPPLVRPQFPIPPFPPDEIILGGIVEQYHQAIDRANLGEKPVAVQQLIDSGLKRAFTFHVDQLEQQLKIARVGFDLAFAGNQRATVG